MVTRLNAELRRSIALRCLAVLFAKANKRFAEIEAALAQAVLDAFLTMAKQALIETLPKKWLAVGDGLDIMIGGRRMVRERLKLASPRPLPAFMLDEILRIKPGSALSRKIRQHSKRRGKHERAMREAKSIMLAFMEAIPNTKRLVEVWPEVKPIVDSIEAEIKVHFDAQKSMWVRSRGKRSHIPFAPGEVPSLLKRLKAK